MCPVSPLRRLQCASSDVINRPTKSHGAMRTTPRRRCPAVCRGQCRILLASHSYVTVRFAALLKIPLRAANKRSCRRLTRGRENPDHLGLSLETVMKSILALALASALAACASSPVPLSEVRPAPSDRVFYSAPSNATATLIVIRDKRPMQASPTRDIFLDGALVGKLDASEMATFKVAPGEHLIGARQPSWVGGNAVHTVAVIAEPGKTYYFRTGTMQDESATFARAMSPDF